MENSVKSKSLTVKQCRDREELDKERSDARLNESELQAAIERTIQRIEDFFMESAFLFRHDLNACEAEFKPESEWLEDLVMKLDPGLQKLHDRLDAALTEMRKRNGKYVELDADLTDFWIGSVDLAYIVGILFGAKACGRSAQDLRRMAALLNHRSI